MVKSQTNPSPISYMPYIVPQNGKAILNASSILANLSPPQLLNALMVKFPNQPNKISYMP